jgi:ferredoxin
MAEAHIQFEREDLDGIIPVGSYIGEALRRFGIKGFDRCSVDHDCAVRITKGENLLSPMTSFENEHFASDERQPGERLACHAKIVKAGDIVVMTHERKEEPKPETASAEDYRKQFTEMPLEQKIGELMKLEAIALGETCSFILNSPYLVFEKVGDVMAGFGMKLENKAREAQRPAEHSQTTDNKKQKKSAAAAENIKPEKE